MSKRANGKHHSQDNQTVPEPEVFVRFPPPLHGHLTTLDRHNRRIQMFAVTAEDLGHPDATGQLRSRFDENEAFTKLTAYALDGAAEKWKELGFRKEGRIRYFFRDGSDATLWTRYSDESRATSDTEQREREVLEIAAAKEPIDTPLIPGEFDYRLSTTDDAERISALLTDTFPQYPVDRSADVLRKLIMRHQVVYGILEIDGEIVSLAGVEVDAGWNTAEITDCVTIEPHRGRRLMVALIDRIVNHVASSYKITDFYSLARAQEIGMNAALARAGFEEVTFGGGTKAVRATSNKILACVRQPASTASLP